MSGMGGSSGDSGVSSRIRGILLTWLAEKKSDVFVVATANSILDMPPEMTRLGRWDCVMFVDLPNYTERVAIWKIHLGIVHQLHDKIDVEALASASNGYSGAEIEAVIQEAMYSNYVPGTPFVLTTEMVQKAMSEMTPLSVARAADLRALRDWAAANAKPASAPDTSSHSDEANNKMGFRPTV